MDALLHFDIMIYYSTLNVLLKRKKRATTTTALSLRNKQGYWFYPCLLLQKQQDTYLFSSRQRG
jgi:hypothetical protein